MMPLNGADHTITGWVAKKDENTFYLTDSEVVGSFRHQKFNLLPLQIMTICAREAEEIQMRQEIFTCISAKLV
jgi:hypothetical protein